MVQKTKKRKKQTKGEGDGIKSNHVRVTEGLGNGLAIDFLKEFAEPFIITTEISHGLKLGFFDAFQNNGDAYVATKEDIIEYATTGNGNGKGLVTIDEKDPTFDKEKFRIKLDKWLELMETAQIIRRDNGTYCLEPLAVHFRKKNGVIRSLLNEITFYIRTLDDTYFSNIWGKNTIDSLIGTQKYDFIEKHLEECSSVLCQDIPQFLEEFDIKLKKGSIVLDVGCGNGSFLEELARLYKIRGLGLDFNWKTVENGNKRLKELGLSRMVDLRYMDVAKQKLPANDNIVDLVLTINLHQYFKSKHYEHLTQEIHRILKPGGTYFSVIAVELPEDHPSKCLSTGLHSQLSKIFTDFTEFVDMEYIRELYENAGFNMKTFETLPLYSGIQEVVVVKKQP